MESVPSKEKLYYSIGEVKELTGVEPHVLRYWESEFPTFNPRKTRSGQRAYTRKDIDMALMIKRLLYEEKFTIKGAKIKLKERKNGKINTARRPSAVEKDTGADQLLFDPIEHETQAQRSQRDFLRDIRKKLLDVSSRLREML